MAKKFCEFCKQAYADNLPACPNCDVADLFGSAEPGAPGSQNLDDLFGGSTATGGATGRSPAESDVDLGGDPLAMFDPMSGVGGGQPPTKPNLPLPPTKFQGPVPGAELPSSSSPLMSRAASGPEASAEPPAKGGKMTQLPSQATAPVTMLAPRAGQPTALAPSSAAPTQISDEPPAELPPDATIPTDIPLPHGKRADAPSLLAKSGDLEAAPTAPEDAKKTMLARGSQPTMLAKPSGHTQLAPAEQNAPLDLPPDDADSPKKTMLAKQASQTVLAPDQGPMDYPPGEKPKATMLAKQAGSTVLAPAETQPYEYPPGEKPKATMLAKQASHTVLAPSETQPLEYPAGEKPKATMLAKTQNPTVLVPPEHNDPLALPPGHDDLAAQMESVDLGPDGRPVTPTLSGEMARAALEGGSLAATTEASLETEPIIRGKVKKPSYLPRWIGGMILGSGITIALWFLGFDLPQDWRDKVGLAYFAPKAEASWEEALQHLKVGRFKKHLAVNPGSADKPEQIEARGEATWLQYLQEKVANGEKLNRGDDPVQAAVKDLTDAAAKKNADAVFFLAQIEEFTGEPVKARDAYAKGAKDFPKDKRRFEAAQVRVEERLAGEKKPEEKKEEKPATRLNLPLDNNAERVETLVLVLAALQAGDKPPAGEATTNEAEAGYKYWDAVKLAREGNFKAAADAVKEARTIHDKKRFARLRQQQNPDSDPNEEIFLRAASDLEKYYLMRAQLSSAVADVKDPVRAVETIIADRKKPDEALAEIVKGANEKLGLGIKEPKTVDILKGIDDLAASKKLADELKAGLKAGKYVEGDEPDYAKGLQALLTDGTIKAKVAAQIEKAGIKEADLEKATGILITERDELRSTTDTIAKKLQEAEFLPAKADLKELLAGVDRVVDAANSPLVSTLARTFSHASKSSDELVARLQERYDVTKRLTVAEARLAQADITLMQSRTPKDMLAFWLPVLENRRNQDAIEPAALDAKRVLEDKLATPETKAHARAVEGLALRNSGKFDDARTALDEALKSKKADWHVKVAIAIRQLSKPENYYLPEGEHLLAVGQPLEALEVFGEGTGAFPKDGKLLALRGLATLEVAKSKAEARLSHKDKLVEEAKKDAVAAEALGAVADANYLLGRIEEETGTPAKAEPFYRKAVAAHPLNDLAGSRYRVALGRVLLGPLPSGPSRPVLEAPAKKPEPVKVGQLPTDKASALALILTGAIAADDDDQTPELDEIIRLADEAIRAKNYEGYLIKAGALARKGYWTEALKEYNEGLKRLIKPEYSKGLSEIVYNHPAFNLPDPLRIPDPARADKHYSAGLRFYFAGRFADAETELYEAYRNQGQDARILYFLGLSELMQGKKDRARVAFQMAYNLEQQSKPGPVAVNASLERVQGETRKYLDQQRGQ